MSINYTATCHWLSTLILHVKKILHMDQRFYNKMIMNFEVKARMQIKCKTEKRIMDNNADFCQIQKRRGKLLIFKGNDHYKLSAILLAKVGNSIICSRAEVRVLTTRSVAILFH